MDDSTNIATPQPATEKPVVPGKVPVNEKGFVVSTDKDIDLICPDCHDGFVFSVREQKIYEKYEYKPPKRDKKCRIAREEKRLAKKKEIAKKPTYR